MVEHTGALLLEVGEIVLVEVLVLLLRGLERLGLATCRESVSMRETARNRKQITDLRGLRHPF